MKFCIILPVSWYDDGWLRISDLLLAVTACHIGNLDLTHEKISLKIIKDGILDALLYSFKHIFIEMLFREDIILLNGLLVGLH